MYFDHIQPLKQFELYYLGDFAGIAISNALLSLAITCLIIQFSFCLMLIRLQLIPYNWQIFIEEIYIFVFNLVKQQIKTNSYQYFPIILTLFLYILVSNLLGLCGYTFTTTSHVIIAFTLSFSFFIAIVIIGVLIQKKAFINTFIPSGAPKALKPFLIGIEILSYLSRPLSLGIRLFANLMAGHTLLAILANFFFLILKKNIIIAILPFILIVAIVGLEAMIAILQAYVFTVLVCIYLNDSIQGAH